MPIFGAYLEDYHLIKIIVPSNIQIKSIKLTNELDLFNLVMVNDSFYYDEHHIIYHFDGCVCLHCDYYVMINNDLKYYLQLGKITTTQKFDEENYYDGPLGVEYNQNKSIFRVWSPVAKEIKLVLNDCVESSFSYIDKGLWELSIDKNLLNYHYYYLVRINNDFIKSLDPYGLSCSINYVDNIIVDESINSSDLIKYVNFDNPSILEVSVRDFSYCHHGGTLLEFDKHLHKLLKYQDIGVNTIQIMPVFGFGGVDELKKEDYNWGYNPISYFSISNYLTKGRNPNSGILELKRLIKHLHKVGFSVTMDVVFNHVYDYQTFSYAILVPGYFFHTDERGFLTNNSGCGNDFNTTKLMARRFIVDNLVYFTKNFGFDGFRFDLMGLLDIDTLKLAESRLSLINKSILLYGEGWNMNSNVNPSLRPNFTNSNKLLKFSYFNDQFRENVKQYCLGNNINNNILFSCLTGYSKNNELFSSYKQSINYIECHDGFTFYDFLIHNNINDHLEERVKLGISIIMFSLGIHFLQLGQESLRSKKGVENSYNSNDLINYYDYNNLNKCLYKSLKFLNLLILKENINLNDNFQLVNSPSFMLKNDRFIIIFKNNLKDEELYVDQSYKLIYNGTSKSKLVSNSFKLNNIGVYIFKKL